MSRDGGFQAARAAGENFLYNYSHFMLIFVVGPIQAAIFYAFSAQRMRAARRRVRRVSSRGQVAAVKCGGILKSRKHCYFILQIL
jgi:hypothetical protein